MITMSGVSPSAIRSRSDRDQDICSSLHDVRWLARTWGSGRSRLLSVRRRFHDVDVRRQSRSRVKCGDDEPRDRFFHTDLRGDLPKRITEIGVKKLFSRQIFLHCGVFVCRMPDRRFGLSSWKIYALLISYADGTRFAGVLSQSTEICYVDFTFRRPVIPFHQAAATLSRPS